MKLEIKVISPETIKKRMTGHILSALEDENFMTKFVAVYPDFPVRAKESYIRMTGYKKLENI